MKDQLIKNKKKLFKSKTDVFYDLDLVDKNSECVRMLDLSSYIEKEKSKIVQKYQNRGNIDETVLGDYLVNYCCS